MRLDLYRTAQNVTWLATRPGLPPGSDMETEICKCRKQGTNFKIHGWIGNDSFNDRLGLLERTAQLNKDKGKIECVFTVKSLDGGPRCQMILYTLKRSCIGVSMFRGAIFALRKIPEWHRFYNIYEAYITEYGNEQFLWGIVPMKMIFKKAKKCVKFY
jgi:hypothetical protein